MKRNWRRLNVTALKAVFCLFAMAVGAAETSAQDEPTAWLTIQNSTDATLSVSVSRGSKSVNVTLPPLTESRVLVYAGYVTFYAQASLSSPMLTYEERFAISNGGRYSINLTPQQFGTSYLADRPSASQGQTGLTVNQSRAALQGDVQCSEYGQGVTLTTATSASYRDFCRSNDGSRSYEWGGKSAGWVCSENKARVNAMKTCQSSHGGGVIGVCYKPDPWDDYFLYSPFCVMSN